jgi:hypothetical protein
MGTWGPGVFENDTACDFAATVSKRGVQALIGALDRVLSIEGGYLESPDAAEGLAAAEVIARLKGSPGKEDAYTASVDAWVRRSRTNPTDELVEKAKRSIARILAEPSELLELWQESEDFDDWKSSVEAISRSSFDDTLAENDLCSGAM